MSDSWRNTKNEVCSLCSNLEDGIFCKLDLILTLPKYLKYAIEATSSDCLISINESLYCEDCWDEHIRTDELIEYEKTFSYFFGSLSYSEIHPQWPIKQIYIDYWGDNGWIDRSIDIYSSEQPWRHLRNRKSPYALRQLCLKRSSKVG